MISLELDTITKRQISQEWIEDNLLLF